MRIFILLVIGFFIYMAIKWNVSASQIKAICEEAKTNSSIIDIKESLKDSWLLKFREFVLDGKNIVIVHSGASYGRYTCFIEYKDGKVLNSNYTFLD